MKIKYSAKFEGQEVGTRSSAREYTHAVLVTSEEYGHAVLGFCGSIELAQKRLAEFRKRRPETKILGIVEVEKA